MIQRFLILWLILSSALAFYWPSVSETDIFKAKWTILPSILIIMFFIGSLLPVQEVKDLRHRWKTVLSGTFVQYLVMPSLAFLIVKLGNFNESLSLGIMLVGCVPGAMASNVLTLQAKGNVSYSVSLTTSATLLSPILVPAVFYFVWGSKVPTEVIFGMGKNLLIQVVLPVGIGFATKLYSKPFERFSARFGPAIANLVILWLIAVVVGLTRERLVMLTPALFIALLAINLLGYCFGYFSRYLIGIDFQQAKALTIEVGMQNAGVGTLLAAQMFPEHTEALIPTALYTFGCMLTGTMLATYWSFRAQDAEELQTESETKKPLADS